MREVKTQFGGGVIHPKVQTCLKGKAEPKNIKSAPKTEFGGGFIHPKLKTHQGKSACARTQFGAGMIHPLIGKHLRRTAR